jgi:predicted dehydrogenase
MTTTGRVVRVAVLGCGRFANSTHLPNLARIEGAQVVAVCDQDGEAARATAARFGVPHAYTDGFEMLAHEQFEALFSIVPAYGRTADGPEAAAARQGIHLFSEKPQADDLAVAIAIDRAVQAGDVISTVGFRERYRPLYQEVRERMAGSRLIHARVHSARPWTPPAGIEGDWWWGEYARRGGWAMEWGVHAVDYVRYMAGLDVVSAQAFYFGEESQPVDLSQALHFQLESGASMDITALTGVAAAPAEPLITLYHEQGTLGLVRHGQMVWSLVENGETLRTEEMDPWLAHDRQFIAAVRAGDPSLLRNDYHDGLASLAPILLARESARRGGACLDVPSLAEIAPRTPPRARR